MAVRRRDLVEIIADHERQIKRMQATLARVGSGGGGGVTDHGALTGLTDDDHGQYLTNARGDARYSLLAHGHALDLEGLDDVTLNAIGGDEILKWNGTAWINNTLAEAGIAAVGDLHTKYTDGEADARIAIHDAIADAHHTRYADSEAVTAVGTPWVALIAAEDHHTKYTDGNAVSAMGVLGNGNALNHSKYTDGEVDAIVATHDAIASAHHTRYSNSEAVSAMGALGDGNDLNHNRYTDGEVDSIVATHDAIASAHHTKYTDGEVDAIVLTHKNLASAHHTKYTDGNAVSAVGTPWVGLIAAEDHHTKYTDGEAVSAVGTPWLSAHTMTGLLTLSGLPTVDLHAATKKYVDDAITGSGGYVDPLTTKGDILGFDTNTSRVPVGSNDQVLTADSGQTLGVKWSTPHTKYTDGNALTAMGVLANFNTYNHNRYLDSEAAAKIASDDLYVKTAGDTMTGALLLPAGTAPLPAVSFDGATNKGMFDGGTDILSWATAGVERLQIDAGGSLRVGSPLTTGMAIIRNSQGTIATPTYGFIGDFDSGMLRMGANWVGIATDGILGFSVDNEWPTPETSGGRSFVRILTTGKVASGVAIGSITIPRHPTRNSRWAISVTGHAGFASIDADLKITNGTLTSLSIVAQTQADNVNADAAKFCAVAKMYDVRVTAGTGNASLILATSSTTNVYWRTASHVNFLYLE